VECVEGGSIFDWAEAPLIYEYEHYNEFHKKRLAIRSGITGLWQVSGKSSLSFKQMVMLDVRYINEWSIWLDLKILLETVPFILKGWGGEK
jgi:lipopolysaccharide/colanic/teichoic acid biosynthesis glycosyltransferase